MATRVPSTSPPGPLVNYATRSSMNQDLRYGTLIFYLSSLLGALSGELNYHLHFPCDPAARMLRM